MRGPWNFEEPRCKGVDTEMYYPVEASTHFPEKKLIVSICGSCVHQAECADWGIRHERFGIWGGLNETQRKEIRKQKNIVLPFGEFCA